MPEVVEAVRAAAGDARSCWTARRSRCVDDGRPRPFQETGAARRLTASTSAAGRLELPLSPFVFDVLHLDGDDLLDQPGHVAAEALRAAVPVPPAGAHGW